MNQQVSIDLNVTEAALEELAVRYAAVPDATTTEGYTACKTALKELTPLRTGVEKSRKKLKADSLEYGRRIDAEAERVTLLLTSIENPIRAAKQVIDDAEKRRKEEHENRLNMKLSNIRNKPLELVGLGSQQIADALEEVSKIDHADFYEKSGEAAELIANVTDRLTDMITQALQNERVAAENKAMAEENARLLAATEALNASNAIQAEENARLQAEADALKASEEIAADFNPSHQEADTEPQAASEGFDLGERDEATFIMPENAVGVRLGYKVVDLSMVPRDFLTVDGVLVIDAIEHGTRNIPGIEIIGG